MLVASGVSAGAAVAVAVGASVDEAGSVGVGGLVVGTPVAGGIGGVSSGAEVAARPSVVVVVVGSGTLAEEAVGNTVVDVGRISVAEELQATANSTSIPARPTDNLRLLPPIKHGFIHSIALTESPASATGNPAVI